MLYLKSQLLGSGDGSPPLRKWKGSELFDSDPQVPLRPVQVFSKTLFSIQPPLATGAPEQPEQVPAVDVGLALPVDGCASRKLN